MKHGNTIQPQTDYFYLKNNSVKSLCPDFNDVQSIKLINSISKKSAYFLRGTILISNIIVIIAIENNKFFLYFFDMKPNLKIIKKMEASLLSLSLPNLISSVNTSLIVTDDKNGRLLTFDSELNLTNSIDANVEYFNDMCVDSATNEIYLVRCVDKVNLKILNYQNNSSREIKKIWDNFRPRFIKVVKNKVFIVNACCIKLDNNNIIENIYGENYIYIFDKSNFHLINLIDLNLHGYCQPWSLFVDENFILLTTILKFKEKTLLSTERTLIKISNKELNEIFIGKLNFLPTDMFSSSNNLVFYKENLINFYSI